MKFKPNLVFLFICLIFLGCKKNDSLEGVWIGGGYLFDKEVYLPIPTLLSFSKEKLLLKNINSKADTLTYQLHADRLILNLKDTFSYKRNGQLLKWKQRVWTNFYKCKNENLALDVVEKRIIDTYWKGEKETISFAPQGKYFSYLKNDLYNEYCYKLYEFESKIFLFKYGNAFECANHYQYVEQVISIDESSLKVIRWEENQFKEIIYTSINKEGQYYPNDFQLCNKYLNKNYPNHKYYAAGTSYKGGLYKIRKELTKKYIRPQTKENGIIRIRFVVNCQGKTGDFEMLELDKDYKEKTFDSTIPAQLLSFTKELNDWIPGIFNGKNVDTYKFLTFKIKDSEITEIFP